MQSPPAPSSPSLQFTLPSLPVARVLHQIRVSGEPTRSSLREELGYSQPSITRHVAALTDAGLVEEAVPEPSATTPGRPRAALRIDGRHLTFWGAHVGVRSTVLVVADGGGRTLRQRTIPLNVQDVPARDALTAVARQLRALGEGLPAPVDVGVGFSAHIDDDGLVSSEIYRWEGVDAAGVLATELRRPVGVANAVSAMSAAELLSHPLTVRPTSDSSTLYFYVRDVVAHGWVFRGGVHRPRSGRTPGYTRDVAAAAGFPGVDLEAHVHPLSNTAVLHAARARGIEVDSFAELVDRPGARDLLDARARLLGEVLSLAIDVVDPDTLVFAGEAFTGDPEGLKQAVSVVRAKHGGTASLRIQRADQDILSSTARLIALNRFWQDPLGAGWRPAWSPASVSLPASAAAPTR